VQFVDTVLGAFGCIHQNLLVPCPVDTGQVHQATTSRCPHTHCHWPFSQGAAQQQVAGGRLATTPGALKGAGWAVTLGCQLAAAGTPGVPGERRQRAGKREA
jgi:hypothetical protein